MSIKHVNAVWESGLKGSTKSIALKYADFANHDGKGIYPSIAYMSWLTGYGKRTVSRAKAKLIEMGVLIKVCEYIDRPDDMAINISKLPKRETWREYRRQNNIDEPDIPDPMPNMQDGTDKLADGDMPNMQDGTDKLAPYPPVNPPVNPEGYSSSSDLDPKSRYDGVKTLPPTKGDAENKAYNLLMVACDEIKCDLSKKKDVDYLIVLYNLLPSDNTQAVQAIKDFVSWWLDEEKKGKPPTVGQVAGFWPQFKEWQVDSMTTYHLLKPLTELKRKDSPAAVNLLKSDEYKTVKAIMRANNIGDIRALEYETEESWKSKEKKWRKAND